MTFKHTKFEDSATMRSLEKLAKDKGLVKSEPITKTASTQLDLSPSDSLTENVMKLCAGLKSAGFNKYADELESKYINYKHAQTLYEVNKEKGEDLVDAAHPQGSHKLEGVEGEEATVETIIDQNLKMLKVVEKTPHGKLSSSSDVINAVKKALGQQSDLDAKLADDMKKVRLLVQRIVNAAEPHLTASVSEFQKKGLLNRAPGFEDLAATPTIGNLKRMQSLYKDFAYRLRPGTFMGLPESVWTAQVEPLMNYLQSVIEDAIQVRQQIDEKKASETTESLKKEFQGPGGGPTTDALNNQIATYINNLSFWKQILNSAIHSYTPEQKAQAASYIDAQMKEFQDVQNQLKADPNTGKYAPTVQKLIKESDDFYASWIKDKK